MRTDRRDFMKTGLAALTAASAVGSITGTARGLPHNKKLGTIQNDDANALYASSGKDMTPAEFKATIRYLLDGKANVLAYCVGLPDPVYYRSKVATTYSKYLVDVSVQAFKDDPDAARKNAIHEADAMNRLLDAGTDPLRLAIDVCRERSTLIVASYRMNSEDWYENTWQLADFGRVHPDWRIAKSGALDPAIPEVYDHRMKIFREVAENYDLDGIEFDFRRWNRMISKPLENYPVLTKMVRETHAILQQVTRRKGRGRMLLGVRVGPSVADPSGTRYPGGDTNDISCRDLGLDVKTWIDEEIVDYVCPSLFWPRFPGLPKTAEFAALAREKKVGIYPTVFPIPSWISTARKKIRMDSGIGRVFSL